MQKYPKPVRTNIGVALNAIQHNDTEGLDIKPFEKIGLGVEEVRVRLKDGTYRVFYIAKFPEAVYVLHIFQKKTQQTPEKEKKLAKKRYSEMLEKRRKQNERKI